MSNKSVFSYIFSKYFSYADEKILHEMSEISNPKNERVVFTIRYLVRKISFSILIALLLAGIPQISAQVKIMPLGNSITDGVGDSYGSGYRSELFDLLEAAGYNFNFVGTQNSGTSHTSNPDFNSHHEGHPGWFAGLPIPPGAFDIKDNLITGQNFLNLNPPNVILLHIGTNDVGESGYPKTYTQVDQDVDSILSIIYNYYPDHRIVTFLAKIIDDADKRLGDTAYYSLQTHIKTLNFNSILADTVVPNRSSNQKIIVVDMYNALGRNYHTPTNPYFNTQYDVHPNTLGYNKMADTWFAAMQKYYKPVLAGPDSAVTGQPVNVVLSWNASQAASDMLSHSESFNYELQVATNPDFALAHIVFSSSSIPSGTTSSSPSGLQYGTQYFWRVKISNYGWSNVWNFTTKPLQVLAKVFLQGPYAGNDSMHTNLNYDKILKNNALSQPYNVAPWNYAGSESVGSTFFDNNPSIVDWVLVDLRTGTDSSTTIKRKAAFLKKDGSIVGLNGNDTISFSGISSGNYYVVVRHRDHLAVMSSIGISTNPINYNFTTGSGQYYGGSAGAKQLETSVWGMVAGDANKDGQITGSDFNVFNPKFMSATSGYENADWNMDGQVTGTDFNIFNPNFIAAKVTQVP